MSKSELNDILRFGTTELFKDDNAKDGGKTCFLWLQELLSARYYLVVTLRQTSTAWYKAISYLKE